MVQNGIPSFFSSENGSERNSEVFSSENGLERNSKVYDSKMVCNGIPRVFSSKKWFGTEFRGFSLP
jgi:hypothetical protein